MSGKNLQIGELAKLVEVSQDTLRFYEKHGLLAPSLRPAGEESRIPGDGARGLYPERQACWLHPERNPRSAGP